MDRPKVVSQAEWLTARKEFLIKEKEFTRLRDQLSAERRELPWVKSRKELYVRRAKWQGNARRTIRRP